MALTRSFLKGMDLTDEQIASIIEAHTETVDALKEQRDKYKDDSKKLGKVQKELDDLKKDDWKQKYEDEHSAFEKYKTDQTKETTKKAKETAFKKALADAGMNEKGQGYVLKTTDFDSIELNEDGTIKNSDDLIKGITDEWSDFVTKKSKRGLRIDNPPGKNGGETMTRDEIMKIKDPIERQRKIAENIEVFQKG
ncbi:MAG: hypothetical protein Q4D45_12955 [Lachnospiraceae bacterium]|nr:hypothetical protein [Lachnospiraceae bacterium]